MDRPEFTCPRCKHNAGSKFALKRHRALCEPYGHTGGRAPVELRPRQQFVRG